MKDILTAPFVEEMKKTAANMYRLGWDERNAGNISYMLDEKEVGEYLDLSKVIRTIPTGFDASELSGKTIDTINIVGGGSKDGYLNELTKKYTGKRVLAGPVEATATGNIISQMMFADKELTLEKARELVKNSFNILEVK